MSKGYSDLLLTIYNRNYQFQLTKFMLARIRESHSINAACLPSYMPPFHLLSISLCRTVAVHISQIVDIFHLHQFRWHISLLVSFAVSFTVMVIEIDVLPANFRRRARLN